ncbi:MAG: hypothetical protein CEE43_14720 [Promethearchaeota archaeon Loki_b32]|nr:MAG: hypothetical protein CEE43_14720 [Candidatus Lokiarchaeota archaeon Loki_b32]
MKEITDIFTDFFALMRDDILKFYQNSYSYLKDLILYKKIDLNKKIDTKSERHLISNLRKMLKAIKTGLNTIGVSMDTLNEAQNNFMSTLNQNRSEIQDYNSYFEFYLMNYVNKILFNILIDYLLEKEVKKLENVNLFDLLPPYFVSKLDKFKKKYINPNIKELLIQQDIDNYVNFTDLFIKSKEVSELDILVQLREAKQDIIETLKTPKKDLIRSSIESIEAKSISKKSVSPVKLSAEIDHDIHIELDSGTFLDYFGHFTPIHPDVRNSFRIEKVNLINSKVLNLDFFDLESLYLYISILKMLDLEVPFTNFEILEIVKNYINNKIFSSSKNEIPESRNIFFGLALFSELNLYDKTDLIDLIKIENFINSQIEKFIPEKLELNLHSLLCFKFIIKSQKISINRNLIFDFLLKINLFTLENFKPILDIYHHLALLKLIDKNVSLKQFETPYINEIKKLITPNGSINDLVTESARALLIFDLLNLKNKEPELCSLMLNYIINTTDFFNIENLDQNFNWRNDKLGFKIELEILYWALLASSQYIPVNK